MGGLPSPHRHTPLRVGVLIPTLRPPDQPPPERARAGGSQAAAAEARVIGRPFAKGVSGNPGGRPKGLHRRVRKAVGDDGEKLVEFMVSVLDDEGASRRDRMQACEWLADRGWGRAVQSVEQRIEQTPAGERPLSELSDAELRSLAGLDDGLDLTKEKLERPLRKRYDELRETLDAALTEHDEGTASQ